MIGKNAVSLRNKAKSGGEPRLRLAGKKLVVASILAILAAVGVWWGGRGTMVELPLRAGAVRSWSTPSARGADTPTSRGADAPTSRGTRVYTVIDTSNKVHRAITEDADVRIVGLVGRGEAIVEANEAGRAWLAANPRLTVGGTPGKTFKDVPLRAGELTVTPLRTEDLAIVERTVVANGGEVIGRSGTLANPDLRIRGTDETIAALMNITEARWIENYERPVLFNYNAARTMHVAECWPSSAGDDCGTAGLGLTGAGQLITTCDTGIDTGNVDTMPPDLKPTLIGVAQTYSGETKNFG